MLNLTPVSFLSVHSESWAIHQDHKCFGLPYSDYLHRHPFPSAVSVRRSSNLWQELLLWEVMASVVPAGAAGVCRLECEDLGDLREAMCAFPLALMSEQPIFFCDPGLFRVSWQLSSTESSPCVLCFHHCVGSWSCREDNRHYGLSAASLCPKGRGSSVSLLCDDVYCVLQTCICIWHPVKTSCVTRTVPLSLIWNLRQVRVHGK